MKTDSAKKNKITKEIKRLFLNREPLNLTAVKRRHPKLVNAVYDVRPFWGWKQALADSGIQYSDINVELEDSCVCRICGEEAAILTSHLMKAHQMKPEQYREQFPRAEIMAETVRARRMRAKPALSHWEPVWSLEYALDRAWEIHKQGRSLNAQEVQSVDRPLYNFVWQQGHQWDDVIISLGLDPSDIRELGPGVSLSRSEVVQRLKARSHEGKSLADSHLEREDMRLLNAARRRFGSYPKALRAAGFRPERVRLRKPKITEDDIERLRAKILKVASKHGYERVTAAGALKQEYTSMVFDHLGNWSKACKRFGVAIEDLALFPYACQRHVVEGLRRLRSIPKKRDFEQYRHYRILQRAARRHFGSWHQAHK